ncbi:MAG: reverse transcriptase domain-containing protein, partial [Pseudomonadota bacterium]
MEELGGKIRKEKEKWRGIKMKREVWRVVKEGMWLRWKERETYVDMKNRKMKEEEEKIVEKEMKQLLKQGVLEETEEERKQCVAPIAVAKRGKEQRMVIDFTELNKSLAELSFKQETLQKSAGLLKEGDWMVKLDFKRAFHSVAVKEEYRKFLKIRWRGKIFQFKGMPLGLSQSPYYFNLIASSIAGELRRRGMRLLYYVDDWIILGKSKEEAEKTARIAVELMTQLGMTMNVEKSDKKAGRKREFLGVKIDLVMMKLRIPKKKVKDLKREARKIKEREKVSARDLMRIVGKMVWMASIWKLMKKEMTMIQWEAKKRLKKGWDVKEIVTEELRKVLERVVRTRIVKEDRERRIKREKVTAVITTDAGPRGGAAKLEVNQRVWELVMKWTKEERKESTNWREMKVLERAMERWKELMKGRTVRWITDSEVGASYIRKEIGKEKKLAKIAWRVRRIEVQYKIGVETKVVKGEEIEEVDKMSRIVDKEDYAIEKEVFKRIEKKFGKMEVDLFATRFSRKVDAFVSKEFDPIAIATDAMSIEWRNLGSLYG